MPAQEQVADTLTLLSGGTAFIIQKSIIAPLHRVKILLQTQDANARIRSFEVPRYLGWRDCFARVLAEQGLASFWRGNLIACATVVPQWACFILFRDLYLALLPEYDRHRQPQSFKVMYASAVTLAGLSSSLLLYPLDYARTRLAADVGKAPRDFTGIQDLVKKTRREGQWGLFSAYHGVAPAFLRNILSRALTLGVFDTVRSRAVDRSRTEKFIVAQTVTFSLTLLLHPLDTVSLRMQMQADKDAGQQLYRGVVDCVRRIYREEGWRGFYKGGLCAAANVANALVLLALGELV